MATEPARLKPQDAAQIRAVPLFQTLAERALDALVASSTLRTVPRGTTLFLQDEPADRFFVLLDGWVKLYRLTRDGSEAVVHVIAPGESFAEAAMFANGRFPVCGEAVSDARVMTLTAAGFARCLREDDAVAFAMLGSLSLRLRHLVTQIEQLQVQPAPQRVASFLLRFCPEGGGRAVFTLPFDKALVARRLGMQPETLSRALARLRTAGVETQGSQVTVADLDALRRIGEDGAEGEV
ncbi:cyclic nucleotide-binding domain-containing protein [Azospirillum sp. RWY-5-1]|uniref:Cyclic nucleotide-binding domain-containing protein n=1 Tax=Azospirillum oleiclasticum TaxID=2735135 RepID=A0ABX2T8I3_9PROT|nr:cyclic nucleotide-binding domain-containing protein [Azospirillum oleiclasticum]NYZ13475.1 cyclic nucleotide-binding domain-containing protein [Azospirillum oleiclasticum]NYZ20636.1 cyclic nucleotide-binding domain-containing protein [Azospirillum oleiclasticum]